MAKIFDPFNDRLSRDIRNALSSALVSRLRDADTSSSMDEVTSGWLSKAGEEVYRNHILDCRNIYGRVIEKVRAEGIHETRLQSLVLWNAGLFFEMHELLETIWHGSKGNERKALKGLIQSAGVYVHRQRNNMKAARGLARRARENLQAAPHCLQFIRNLDQLVEHLRAPDAPPPKLLPGKGA